jgi:hypothetical protein
MFGLILTNQANAIELFFSVIIALQVRRDGREAECARLEIWYTVYRIEGSNPSLSATG